MKTFTIGRDPDLSIIVLYDSTDTVSRCHATLVYRSGKFYLTDHSTNGTYRNGVKLLPNIEYRIFRDDVISFANVAYLDWNMIPNRNNKIIFLLPAAVLLIGILFYLLWHYDYLKPTALFNEKADDAELRQDADDLNSIVPDENLFVTDQDTVVSKDPAPYPDIQNETTDPVPTGNIKTDNERPRIVYPPIEDKSSKASTSVNKKQKKQSNTPSSEKSQNEVGEDETKPADSKTDADVKPIKKATGIKTRDSVEDKTTTNKIDAI